LTTEPKSTRKVLADRAFIDVLGIVFGVATLFFQVHRRYVILFHRTPLGEAAAHNNLHIVQMLLDRRVDVTYKTRQRTTASMLARLHGNEEVLKVLEMREGLQRAHDALIRAITLSDVEYGAVQLCASACSA
jgi:hypothetical protein